MEMGTTEQAGILFQDAVDADAPRRLADENEKDAAQLRTIAYGYVNLAKVSLPFSSPLGRSRNDPEADHSIGPR